MPTYSFICPVCKHEEDAITTIAERNSHPCDKCGVIMDRAVVAPAVRGDVFSWSNENKGRGRYISQLQRTMGKKVDPNAFCKNRDEISSKAAKLDCGIDKSVY